MVFRFINTKHESLGTFCRQGTVIPEGPQGKKWDIGSCSSLGYSLLVGQVGAAGRSKDSDFIYKKPEYNSKLRYKTFYSPAGL